MHNERKDCVDRGVGASTHAKKRRTEKNCRREITASTVPVARRVFRELRNDDGHVYGLEALS
jgi:hypothetical protein